MEWFHGQIYILSNIWAIFMNVQKTLLYLSEGLYWKIELMSKITAFTLRSLKIAIVIFSLIEKRHLPESSESPTNLPSLPSSSLPEDQLPTLELHCLKGHYKKTGPVNWFLVVPLLSNRGSLPQSFPDLALQTFSTQKTKKDTNMFTKQVSRSG